jgi:hypothetical protein
MHKVPPDSYRPNNINDALLQIIQQFVVDGMNFVPNAKNKCLNGYSLLNEYQQKEITLAFFAFLDLTEAFTTV